MKRPELETDPAKMPGQIINRHPEAKFLRDYIALATALDAAIDEFGPERLAKSLTCCHKTVLERCEGCPYAGQ